MRPEILPRPATAADWFAIAKEDARRAAVYRAKRRSLRLHRALARSASDSALCCLARALFLRDVMLEGTYLWEREGMLNHAANKALSIVYDHPHRHGGR